MWRQGVLDGSLLGHSHPVFDLGEGLLDRVQVGRIGRQEREPCAGGADHAADGGSLVRSEVVHNDDVSGPEHWHEQLLDVGTEALAVDWAFEDAWCRQPVAAQRTEEGQSAPVAEGCEAAQVLAFRSPAPERRHIGLNPGLVDKGQPLRVKTSLPQSPSLPPTGDVGACLLKTEQRIFLNLSPSRRRNNHTALCETFTPRAANSSFSPCSVR